MYVYILSYFVNKLYKLSSIGVIHNWSRDLYAILVLPVIDTNLKMFYDKCWQEKLHAEFAVRGETHGGNKQKLVITEDK